MRILLVSSLFAQAIGVAEALAGNLSRQTAVGALKIQAGSVRISDWGKCARRFAFPVHPMQLAWNVLCLEITAARVLLQQDQRLARAMTLVGNAALVGGR